MEQLSKDFVLPEERLASEEISEGRREEYATPSTGRMAQNPATTPTHQTWSDEKLCKSHGPNWISVQVSGSVKRKLKRVFLWVLRSASSSETICSTIYFRVTRIKLGTRFVWCHLTSSGISGQKTTRN
jgi:hypothetical protein